MSKAKKFKVKKKENLLGSILRGVVKIIKRKMKVVNLNDSLPEGAIMIANHSGASGPMTYRRFLTPPSMMVWGAYQMLEGYRERRRYLIDIFYGQKLGYSKKRSKVSGTLFGIVSRILYKTAGVIPVYYDNRLKETMRQSIACLDENVSVLIFPENAENGYQDFMSEDFYKGYITLSKIYKKHSGREVPVYTLYHSKADNVVVVGKPHYVSEIAAKHGKENVNRFFRNYMNELRENYVVKNRNPAVLK